MANQNSTLTKEILHDLFDYKDGNLYWKEARSGTAKGSKVGTLNKDGYIHIKINGKRYSGHRVIFLYHHGYLPKYVDHINGKRSDNNILNLRNATREGNAQNKRIQKNNKSGVKGVYWRKDQNVWAVAIKANGVVYRLGHYKDFDQACLVSNENRVKLHKDFAKFY